MKHEIEQAVDKLTEQEPGPDQVDWGGPSSSSAAGLSTVGTGLIGYMYVTYDELVRKFGEPIYIDEPGRKSDVQWILMVGEPQAVLMTIYNYKDGINYLGPTGTPEEQITNWHVGGFDFDVDTIKDFLRHHGLNLTAATW